MLRFTIAVIICVAYFSGCATSDKYLGLTEARFGDNSYKSTKNQENFNAEIELDEAGKPRKVKVSTTATTPEAAILATAQANLEAWKMISVLVDKLVAGIAAKGAGI